ncbi:MAG TPA: hypothetical protein VHO91_00715 [Rhodopila sp.]|nr:hypothetical protein [Rhodopila sp.]
MSVLKRLGAVATIAGLVAIGIAAVPHDAKAWWREGYGIGVVLPPVVVAPPVYAPPPVYVPPPVAYVPPPPPGYYVPRRIWIPPHWRGPYWVPGHWS